MTRDSAIECRSIPVRIDDVGRLEVAMVDPTDIDTLVKLEAATSMTVAPLIAPESSIRIVIDRLYPEEIDIDTTLAVKQRSSRNAPADPVFWDLIAELDDGDLNGLVATSTSSPNRPGYRKAVVWQRRPSDARGVLADARWDIIQFDISAGLFNNVLTRYWPYDNLTTSTSGIMAVDARHARSNVKKSQCNNTKSLNMLFSDLHAATVTPREAYNAIRNPGRTKLPTDP